MASGASFSSFSSSSSSSSFKYDVFLSFRGKDTRRGFTDYLYESLVRKGIHTFVDDKLLQRGEEISSSLVKAIEASRIGIVVFSENYAASSYCLDELVHILDRIKGKGRLVLPVFYGVDPSDVRRQSGLYAQAFARHEERFKHNMEKVQIWRKALHEAANLVGWHLRHGNEYEYKFIERIVEAVFSEINRAPLHVADYPVGLESRVLDVNCLLDFRSDDGVHMVGIYGIGGVGKTTLARAVYSSIAHHFNALCFLDNVREESLKHGLVHLQQKLLCKIAAEKDIELANVSEGIPIIKQKLRRKKVLLVLDDVDKLEQLRALAGGTYWFGSGSRVIITTRDKHVLASHGVERTYEVDALNEKDALELLNWKAFKDVKLDPSYVHVLNRAVAYAAGLPLALEVIGSSLSRKSKEEWNSVLDQYEQTPNKEIQKVLRISYDELDEHEQKFFLDIASFSKGYRLAEVEDILCAHHEVCPRDGIDVLVAKSLITINQDGEVTMHDLVRDMGREIVRQESVREPGKRSRLWCPRDIVQVLEENTGTSKIEMINLVLPNFEEIDWDGEAFEKMKSLKTLIIRNGHFSGGPKHLPKSLRVLEWWGYPSHSLPSDFHPKKLAILKLPYSCLTSLELPELLKKFMNLKVLNLDKCDCITEIPDVSGIPNLEELSFAYCENLFKIHESVGFLEKLRIMDAQGCSKLRTFPPMKLSSLQQLELSDCLSLESFPDILGKMENITQLSLEYTAIKELPFSIRNLSRLRRLELHSCGMLQLPSSIVMLPELEELSVWQCEGLRSSTQDQGEEKANSMVSSNAKHLYFLACNISDEFLQISLTWFANVKELDLSSNDFTTLPACIKECRFLRKLNLDYCKHLREIRGIPPNLETFSAKRCMSLKHLDLTVLLASNKECHFMRELILDDCENLREIIGIPTNIELLSARNCGSLTSSCSSMLLNQELHEGGNKIFCLPGARIPEWFEHRSRGPSISFWFRNKFPAISLCLFGLAYRHPIGFGPFVIINGNEMKADFLTENRFYFEFPAVSDHVLLFGKSEIRFEDDVDEVLLENEWNHVVISVDIDIKWNPTEPFVMQTGLHVIKQKSSVDDIRFTNPVTSRF